MKKLRDIGYVKKGMVLVQDDREYEVTTVLKIDGFGTYVHVNGNESVAIPFGDPLRDDIYVKNCREVSHDYH